MYYGVPQPKVHYSKGRDVSTASDAQEKQLSNAKCEAARMAVDAQSLAEQATQELSDMRAEVESLESSLSEGRAHVVKHSASEKMAHLRTKNFNHCWNILASYLPFAGSG